MIKSSAAGPQITTFIQCNRSDFALLIYNFSFFSFSFGICLISLNTLNYTMRILRQRRSHHRYSRCQPSSHSSHSSLKNRTRTRTHQWRTKIAVEECSIGRRPRARATERISDVVLLYCFVLPLFVTFNSTGCNTNVPSHCSRWVRDVCACGVWTAPAARLRIRYPFIFHLKHLNSIRVRLRLFKI